jgi:CheY-like chemotaxis protein
MIHKNIEVLRSLKLLFVEDEDDLLSIISEALEKLSADFFTASNGVEALEILEQNQDIDIVITDINMPYMNGLEMIKKNKRK